jgi:methionyl-tRNA formyltransferase
VASVRLGDEVLRLWRAMPVERATPAAPGTVLAADSAGVVIAAGEGALCITELQRAGGRRLPAREFLAGCPLALGLRAAPPPAPSAP